MTRLMMEKQSHQSIDDACLVRATIYIHLAPSSGGGGGTTGAGGRRDQGFTAGTARGPTYEIYTHPL